MIKYKLRVSGFTYKTLLKFIEKLNGYFDIISHKYSDGELIIVIQTFDEIIISCELLEGD